MTNERSPNPPPTLEYGHRPRLIWFARHRKAMIALSILLAIGLPLWWYGKPVYQRVMWKYWFAQAMAHRMPAEPVDLIIEEPSRVAGVAGNSDYERAYIVPSEHAFYLPRVVRELGIYDQRLNLSSGRGDVVAFIGEMKRPDGTPRLVVVLGCQGTKSNVVASVRTMVLPIPSWTEPAAPAPGFVLFPGAVVQSTPIPTRLRSGRIDPKDPSGVLFEFEMGAPAPFIRPPPTWAPWASGIIEARLQNDDRLIFSQRSTAGAAAQAEVGLPLMSYEPGMGSITVVNSVLPAPAKSW